MRPTSSELIKLNPLLKRKSPAEVKALMDVIEESGYIWDSSQQEYDHPEIGRGLRTKGLDLFTPDEFKKDHFERVAAIHNNPQAYAKYQRGMSLWQSHVGKFLWAIGLTFLFGWIFLSIKTWLWVLGIIIVSFFIFKKFTFWLITESGYKGPG